MSVIEDWIISPHGIATPKGLFYYCVYFLFFFLFSRRLISEVTERISTKLGHIFTNDCYIKKLVRTPPSIYPHGLEGAKTVFGTDFEIWPNISLQWNIVGLSTIGKKLISRQGLPTCPQIWWTLVHKRLRTVGEFLPAHPINFRIGRHCQPYDMDVI